MTYTHEDKTIEFNIIYKKRKTLGIYIDVYGNIEIRVPKDTKELQVQELVKQKFEWIYKKSNEMKERTKGFKKKTYVQGETFMYLGKDYPIQVFVRNEIDKNNAVLEEDILKVYVKIDEDTQVQEALKRFYFQKGKALIDKRIQYYQQQIKIKPKSFKLSSNKSNWGTCNSKKELTFNWKLIMAPIEVIDYVIVHEMCHLIHMNHDRSFWRLVGKILPDYEECQNWLKSSNWKMVL